MAGPDPGGARPALSPPPLGSAGAPAPRFTVEAVVLDLDGTVLDADVQLHPRTREAVRAAALALPVIVATGRMYRSALPWARELGISAPLVCYQGALVREMPGGGDVPGAVLFEAGVTPGAAVRALEVARAHRWHFQAYANDELLCDEATPEADLYTRISGVQYTLVPDLLPIVRAGGSTKGVCVVPDPDQARLCRETLARALAGEARVTPSRPEFVEVVSPGVSKAAACALVCERLGVAMGHAVAIGDGPNDIEMLDAAGFAIAVAGASDEVLAHADVTCPAPQDGGVAGALHALGIVR